MPKMHISKSIVVDAPADKVFQTITDFKKWQPWSPWLITEPEAKVTVSDDSKSYEWTGKRTGEGNMKILNEEENKSVDIDLNFLKPWKSHADVRFELSENGDGTKVTWLMDSSLPFFLFFMKKMMLAFIGADYERGLDMLKAYVETGSVPSKLEFKGRSNFDGCDYVGIRTDVSLDDVAKQMEGDYGKIHEFAENNPDNIQGMPLTVYHKWDMVNNRVVYTAAIPVKQVQSDLPDGFTSGNIPATEIETVRHIGRYQHLGNAWSTLYSMQQAKEIKQNKKIDPFEIYRNNPRETAEADLITDVNFPLK